MLRQIATLLKLLLTYLLYKLGLGKKDFSGDSLVAPTETTQQEGWWTPQTQQNQASLDELSLELEGTSGYLDVPVLLLEENNQAVLIIDHEFRDIPSWVEWDRTWQKLSIAQMGGALAELALTPEALRAVKIDTIRRFLLVTGPTENRISHFVSIITRD